MDNLRGVAGPYSISYDPTQDPGERFAPEVNEEIAEVAPSTVTNGSISSAKLAEDSVIDGKVADKALKEPTYDDGSVSTRALAAEAVTTGKLAANAVTPEKTGIGVVTAVDSADAALDTVCWFGTAAEYAAIAVKDPNTTYFTTA